MSDRTRTIGTACVCVLGLAVILTFFASAATRPKTISPLERSQRLRHPEIIADDTLRPIVRDDVQILTAEVIDLPDISAVDIVGSARLPRFTNLARYKIRIPNAWDTRMVWINNVDFGQETWHYPDHELYDPAELDRLLAEAGQWPPAAP